MTRGDGGQNLIGDEQGIELGMIRTQELLARNVAARQQRWQRSHERDHQPVPAPSLAHKQTGNGDPGGHPTELRDCHECSGEAPIMKDSSELRHSKTKPRTECRRID